MAAFRRFHEASNLKQQPIATQQGYLLQALRAGLQEIVERKLTPSKPLFGPAGCLDILEGEFRTLYPIFNRRVNFFQVVREPGENADDYLCRLSSLAEMADLGAMTQKELTTFRFIGSCNDRRLRGKIFQLKRKDGTAVRDAVSQYELQQKAEAALQSKEAPITAVQQQTPSGKGGSRTNKQRNIPPQLVGRCTSCGETSHATSDCNVKKREIMCNNCGRPGHLSKVCFSVLRRQLKTNQNQAKSQPIRAITEIPEIQEDNPVDSWLNRLTLNISHKNGSFTFNTFPDTGSTTTLIASNLAMKYGIQPTQPATTKYVSVNGDPVPTDGTTQINLCVSIHLINSNAIISPAIKNEVIIGRDDLKKLGMFPKQFPAPIYIVSESRYSSMRDSLIKKQSGRPHRRTAKGLHGHRLRFHEDSSNSRRENALQNINCSPYSTSLEGKMPSEL